MVWTALGVAGIGCLVVAAFLFGGWPWAVLVAGVCLLAVAIDGSRDRAPAPRVRRAPREEIR